MTDNPNPDQFQPRVDPVLAAIDAAIQARRAQETWRLNVTDDQRATALPLFVGQVRAGDKEAAERLEHLRERSPKLFLGISDLVARQPAEQRRKVYQRPQLPSWDEVEAGAPLPVEISPEEPNRTRVSGPPADNVEKNVPDLEQNPPPGVPRWRTPRMPESASPAWRLQNLRRLLHPNERDPDAWMKH